MILLGFLTGWAAATWYWAWIASLYDKPLPPSRVQNLGGIYNGTKHEWVQPHWKADRGP